MASPRLQRLTKLQVATEASVSAAPLAQAMLAEDERQTDLIIMMGSHGRSTFANPLLASSAGWVPSCVRFPTQVAQ